MTIKELDRKIDDSLLVVFKNVLLDILFSICLLKVHVIQGIFLFFPILLCTVIATYDSIDRICFMKQKRKELEMELES